MSESVEREEEERDKHHIHRAETPTASCRSKDEPGPPCVKSVQHRAESPTPSCVSMKSDWSKQHPPDFSNEPGSPDTIVDQHRAGSPVPSCVSMKSDWSMDRPINFKDGHHNSDHRPESPTPSCVSMKSDWSKQHPPDFSNEPGPPDRESVHHRAESPTPSCMSMKSDWSKQHPPDFSNEPGPPDTKVDQHRAGSATPSCVSMKSDWSKQHPPDFSNEPGPPDTKSINHRPVSPTPSCMSMKSDWSKQHPPDFSNEPGPPDTKLPASAKWYDRREAVFIDFCVEDSKDVQVHVDKSKFTFSCYGPDNIKHQNALDLFAETDPKESKHRRTDRSVLCCLRKAEPGKSWPRLTKDKAKSKWLSVDFNKWKDWEDDSDEDLSSFDKCSEMMNTMGGDDLPDLDGGEDEHEHADSIDDTEVSVQEDLKDFKITLKSLDHVTDVTEVPSLSSIFSELYITVGESEGVNNQHEVYQLETLSKKNTLHDQPINCCDIFKPLLLGRETPIRRVLTKGIAGIGKTFSVRKFTLDWAKGLENQDVILLVPFSFRELNLVGDEQHSLLTLILVFHPTLKKVTAEQLTIWKVGFIFDGLDESRFSFNFGNNDIISDVTVTSSVDRLFTNLIKGNLLPQALIWITTRPAAANQIPPAYVDLVTEVRGFADPQKEEYFRKRFSDEELASRIISHMKTSKSLRIMCHIPVFCWITGTVLEEMVKTDETGQLPKTMTTMCCHFLLVQTERKELKYETQDGKKRKKKRTKRERENQQQIMETDRDVLMKLGRLAFEHLEKGSIMFYQEDLEECGLDVKEASLYSGVCTKIFKREGVVFQREVYCFVHLIIQEFLAAVYLFHCFTQKNSTALHSFLKHNQDYKSRDFIYFDSKSSLSVFLKVALKETVKSKNGHLDLFVRFLHGLSLESNQSLLEGLLCQTDHSPEEIQKAINYLKEMSYDDDDNHTSPDRCINIFHCLMEMNDDSVHQEIQQFLKSVDRSKTELSPIQCSALAHMLQMSEDVLDELDPDTYNTSEEGRGRLIPAVRNSRKARFVGFGVNLMKEHIEIVASALNSNPSQLRHLDLSSNNLGWCLDLLCAALKSPHCRLETLRLMNCWLTERNCEVLASALSSNLHLRELDLNFNVLPVSGLKNFSGLESLHVKHGGELWTNPQLLTRYFHPLTDPCTEVLTGRFYWEVNWGRGRSVEIGVRAISRRGEGSVLGYDDKSWSLRCWGDDSSDGYSVTHNSRHTLLPVCYSGSKVAVCVDYPAGTLSFYAGQMGFDPPVHLLHQNIPAELFTPVHLYTFQCEFTAPLFVSVNFED